MTMTTRGRRCLGTIASKEYPRAVDAAGGVVSTALGGADIEQHRGYRYRLDLTPEQAALARRTAGCARVVYNLALEQRSMWWRQGRKSIGYAAQCAQLVELKAAYPWRREAPSHTLQQALRDLDRAFRNFFEGRAKYPRFRQRGRDDRFRFPDSTQFRVKGSHVQLPKFGMCAMRFSRPIPGQIRNVTVSYEAGHWYISFGTIEEMADPVTPTGEAIGLDVGVANAVTVLRLERSIARKRRHSANQRKARARLARLHARARRRRHDQIHKLTTALAKNHSLIAVESLNIAGMTGSAKGTMEEPGTNVRAKAGLNREILERAWGEINRQLTYKTLWYGSDLVAFPAHYSSQECSECGHVAAENRPSQAVFRCVACQHAEHADANASKIILARGLNELAVGRTVNACGAAA